jgi:glycosyltransferase involved in cell wall biosynthesis
MMTGHEIILGFEAAGGKPSGIKRYSSELRHALLRSASMNDAVSRVEVTARLRPFVAEAWSRGLTFPHSFNYFDSENKRKNFPGNSERNDQHSSSIHSVSLLFPPLVNERVVVTIHDLVPFTHPQFLTSRGAAWHKKMLARAVEQASAIVVPTQVVRDQLLDHFALPRLASSVFVAGGAASLPQPNSLNWPLRPTGPYVVFVGTIEPRKRLDALIAAVALLDTLSLVVVGSPGWGGVDLFSLAENEGLPASRLTFVQGAGDQELANIIAGADALVMPSEAEGFGLPVVEAMALGTPVVHSSDPALCEVAGDGGITVTFHSDKALYAQRLAAGLDFAMKDGQKIGPRGVERSRSFSWDTSAERVWQFHSNIQKINSALD